MTHIDSPEAHELRDRYGVSLATATRWIERGKDECVRRFLERQARDYGVASSAAAHGWAP